LIVARFRALLEVDAKKIVALSTLRQLGLIFISLSIGIVSICFFHILIHALAKANLFIVVGSLLHIRFSQQDSRSINERTLGHIITIRIRISLLRLVGLAFTSGFYSKEQALRGHSFVINSFISSLIVMVVVRITISYCLKLFIRTIKLNPRSLFQLNSYRANQFIPIFILRILVILTGVNFNANIAPYYLSIERLEGFY
jgi:NADH-quinone oxidoreductase subunit L